MKRFQIFFTDGNSVIGEMEEQYILESTPDFEDRMESEAIRISQYYKKELSFVNGNITK